MKIAKTRREMKELCASCGMRNSYKCKGFHADPAGTGYAHCGKEPPAPKETIKVLLADGQVVDQPKTPAYMSLESVMLDKTSVVVNYKGLNDEEPRQRVTFVLAPTTMDADCFRVYTQIEGRQSWGFRVFNPARMLGDPIAAEETDEVKTARKLLERIHLL